MKKIITIIITIFVLLNGQTFQVGENGAVVSASKIASDVGLQIMQKGGNAVDAAIAVGFALAVVYPPAGNIGGGGFMVVREPDGNVTTFNFREKAPRKAHRDMYLDENENPIEDLSLYGPLASGVPGAVAGYALAHRKFGTLDWSDLLDPSVDLARNGFPVSYYIHSGLKYYQDPLSHFESSRNMFYPDGSVPSVRDIIVFPDLANTIERIAEKGWQEFYRGKTAKELVRSVQAAGGLISMWDLKHYKAQEREPVHFTYRGYDVYSMPPPSSGGVCLGQILKTVENFPLSDYGFHSSLSIQIVTEAERVAYANRAHFLGDPDFYNVPVEFLISDSLGKSIAEKIDLSKATPSTNVQHTEYHESEETTHFSVTDKEGWAVSVTTTLNGSYGCKFVAGKTGILMNNEMDDFSIKPGVPNMFGLIGAEANSIQPQKRMLSSMTPTIVTRNDSLMWILGTPGGGTIITSVAQVLMNLIDFDMSLVQAVDASRFHHQWLPDVIDIEAYGFSPDLIDILENKGYKFQIRSAIGDVNAIEMNWDKGFFIGVPDRRRQSAASAW